MDFKPDLEAALEAAKPTKKAAPYTVYTVNDPARPIYWRYERVKHVLSKDDDYQVFIDDDDVGIRYFSLFCHELAKAESPEERYALTAKYPGIMEALQLRKYTALDSLGLLEGFLLTEVDLGWLSNKFSLAPSTIAWYEQLFFDVWSRKDANFWLETEGIRTTKYPGHNDFKFSPQYDRACAYRMFGYHGGIVALELFATGFLTTDTKPHHKELAETFIKRALETSISNEGALMGNSRRKLNKTEGEFLKLASDLASRSLQAGNTEIIQNVQRALAMVTPLVGDEVKEELTKLAEQDADKAALLIGASELRHVEQMKLSLGLELSPETRFLVTEFNKTREQ
jgi:hypothetical protein